jgi:hypothetical protein
LRLRAFFYPHVTGLVQNASSPCYALASGFHAKPLFKHNAADASFKALVAIARALHLPATPSARTADPHSP